MKESDRLLQGNKAWAKQRQEADPEFFARLASGQQPKTLWIGCSDSRVPANTITDTDSGEIFVHRNIANIVVPTDLNQLSVIQYAVEVLKVEHVVVCGHYECGGVKAAMQQSYIGEISHWLRSIRDVHTDHYEAVQGLPEAERVNRLCELNVIAQVDTLAKCSIIQRAWHERGGPWLHGWVYALHDGILRELSVVKPGTDLHPAAKLKF